MVEITKSIVNDLKYDYNLEEVVTADGKIYIADDVAVGLIEDLIADKNRLEEELEDEKQDKQDNYKPISQAEMYGFIDDCGRV